MKILVMGVGNSGTKLLASLIHEIICTSGSYPYHYEPLYWKGENGEKGIVLNHAAIEEHKRFPLLPPEEIKSWPWMDKFIDQLDGLAKFIRAGSRIRCIKRTDVKIIWITRELYDYLGSMQKNFPRPGERDGWHHRPGEYDDFERLSAIYPLLTESYNESRRIEVEAAWWHLHNSELYKAYKEAHVFHVQYEQLCEKPEIILSEVAKYLELDIKKMNVDEEIYSPKKHPLFLDDRSRANIEQIAGSLNNQLYS